MSTELLANPQNDVENQQVVSLKRKNTFDDDRSSKRKPLESRDVNVDGSTEASSKPRITPTLISSEVSQTQPTIQDFQQPLQTEEDLSDEEYAVDVEYDEEAEEKAEIEGEQAEEVDEPLPREEDEAAEILKARGFSSPNDALQVVGKHSAQVLQETVNRYLDILGAPVTSEYESLDREIEVVNEKVRQGIAALFAQSNCKADRDAVDLVKTVLGQFLANVTQAAYHLAEYEDETPLDPETEVRVLSSSHITQALKVQGLPIYPSTLAWSQSDQDPSSEDETEVQEGQSENAMHVEESESRSDDRESGQKSDQHESEQEASESEEDSEESEEEVVEEEDQAEGEDQPARLIDGQAFSELSEMSCPHEVNITEDKHAPVLLQDAAENFLAQLILHSRMVNESYSNNSEEAISVTRRDIENVVRVWSRAPGACSLVANLRV